MANHNLPTIFNLVGLILDIIGVCLVFVNQPQDLDSIENPERKARLRSKIFPGLRNPDAQLLETQKLLSKSIIETVEQTKTKNELIRKKSNKWFLLIVIGFVFQFIGSILNLFHP